MMNATLDVDLQILQDFNFFFVCTLINMFFTPHPLRAVRVLFSLMVSGWAGGQAAGKSLSGLYLRNHKV